MDFNQSDNKLEGTTSILTGRVLISSPTIDSKDVLEVLLTPPERPEKVPPKTMWSVLLHIIRSRAQVA
jgi:hypothetical protein